MDSLDHIAALQDCIPGVTAMSMVADGSVCLVVSYEGITIHSKGKALPWSKISLLADELEALREEVTEKLSG